MVTDLPVVAVDGPAGSGKSSVCRGVARRLGLRYLDTGAMYRAATWAVLQAGIDVTDSDAVATFSQSLNIESGTDPFAPTIHVNGQDVSDPIREDDVTASVSAVSAIPGVRAGLVQRQRDEVMAATAAGQGIVVEGRDITSVVLPHAHVKVYITASAEVRAQRRAAQDHDRGAGERDVEATKAELISRDTKDSSRAVSPLTIAPDAVVVDTSDLDLEQSIVAVCALVVP
ncbi:MAG: (d)CMP kinase [Actinomycetes bacterium]|jgi:CMP/dCMP kinase